MFQSATLKLTGWYLLILMVISILFSFSILETTTHEVSTRLQRFENNLQISPGLDSQPTLNLLNIETDIATANIISGLLIANALIFVLGGCMSYLLALRTLRPIKVAHESQSRFTSDASHELRTPLAAMKTEIEVALRDKSATKKDLALTLKSNLEEVDKLTSLSQMLLNLSRLDHEKLSPTAVNLRTLVNDVVLSYKIPPTRLKIKSAKKVIALGNKLALSELVSVLVDNALKYSPKSSLVTIDIARDNDKVLFQVTNAGDGIKASRLPYIFDRFYRADTSRTNRVGYGLGLSIAKRIVQLSRGEISVTSTPGQSTTFTVQLPIYVRYASKSSQKLKSTN